MAYPSFIWRLATSTKIKSTSMPLAHPCLPGSSIWTLHSAWNIYINYCTSEVVWALLVTAKKIQAITGVCQQLRYFKHTEEVPSCFIFIRQNHLLLSTENYKIVHIHNQSSENAQSNDFQEYFPIYNTKLRYHWAIPFMEPARWGSLRVKWISTCSFPTIFWNDS